jgi:hypothetical protein
MSIVQLPAGRFGGSPERAALRGGLARSGPRPWLRLISTGGASPAFCSGCAAPIDYGAVWRGEEAFCSVECSLGGNRPA